MEIPLAYPHMSLEFRISFKLTEGLIVKITAAQQHIPLRQISCNDPPLRRYSEVNGKGQPALADILQNRQLLGCALLRL